MMATNHNLFCRASQSARACVGMMPLVLLACALSACERVEAVDSNGRL